ncbi:MAG: molybdopterin molybdotransferase MoeA [Methanomicrobiales archaeon]|nr:molybdopterin molybdotransferase MoeA [Methanomicrobiales archaeon]
MNRFLTVVSVEEAVRTLQSLASPPKPETVPLAGSLQRVLAEDVRSDSDIPGFDRSTVDGFAVLARDTVGASDSLPALLYFRGRISMGSPPSVGIRTGECAYIPTGGVLPQGADAVAMIEYSEQVEDQVLIQRPVAPGENVVQRGEDFARGSMILSRGHLLRPQDLGVLAAAGFTESAVYRNPRIGVISTGNELVPVDQDPRPGQVRDANSFMIQGFFAEHGCEPRRYGIVPDDPHLFREALEHALPKSDAVIISGGSSKDVRDVCAQVIGELGEVRIHGISIQPGKPTIIGKIGAIPVIGLPGHPASAYIVVRVLVTPLLERMTGRSFPPVIASAVLAENIPSPKGREDYVRVRLEEGKAIPLFGKSGLLNTLVQSEGMVRIPAGSEGLEAGEMVEVIRW